LSEVGRLDEGLKALEESAGLYRVLTQRNPDAFQPALSHCLTCLGLRLSMLKREEEALGTLEEAVDKLWPFFEQHPAAFADSAGFLLMSLQLILFHEGRPLSSELQERVDALSRLTQTQGDKGPTSA
jgi:hypothetical protein